MSISSGGEESGIGAFPSLDTEDKDVSPAFAERDYRDHRQVYVGLHHMPAEKPVKKASKLPKFTLTGPPKSFRWENGKRTTKQVIDSASEAEGEDGYILPPPPASERVKFILGGSGENEEETPQEKPQLFTELEELCVHWDGNLEWKETARWYKYEENVEEGGDRWSKPHVATLSLYSLFELRSSLMAGTVILDMEANTLADIADNVLDNLILCNKLEEIFRDKVRETLLRKHRHHRSCGFRRNLSNIISSRKSSNILHQSSMNGLKNGTTPHIQNGHVNDNGSPKDNQQFELQPKNNPPKLFRNFSQPAFPTATNVQLRPHVSFNRADSTQGHLVYPPTSNSGDEESSEKMPAFLKKLPPNAEASNILVGEVDFLEKPITAFVRLANSSVIGDLTEVPIPTRFLFIMLGPCLAPKRYHEIGRAISTLMADEVFHDVAYKAKSRDDLIAGIDEFLEQVIVLPPGEWDPSIRIDPPVNGVAKMSRRQNIDNKNIEIPPDNQSGSSETGDSTDGETSNSLVIRKNIGHGLVRDIGIWRSRSRDISDGFNLKCLHTVFFIYILLLAVIVTIGKHHSTITGGFMGVREHLLSLGISGLLFSVFSTQPLLIITLTIPLTLFDGVLYKFCEETDLDYLSFRFWIGMWAIILLLLFVTLNLSNFIYYITRFSIEIFVVLAPLVLFGFGVFYLCKVFEDFSHIAGTYTNRSCDCVKEIVFNNTTIHLTNGSFRDCLFDDEWTLIGEGCMHDVYPFSILLTMCTIFLMIFFAHFQHFGYLPSQVHQFFHNAATFVVVIIGSIVTNQFDINIEYFKVPRSYKPLKHRSSWVVPVFGDNESWVIAAAILPAILLAMLVFVEQQFTACHINRKRKILKLNDNAYTREAYIREPIVSLAVPNCCSIPVSRLTTVKKRFGYHLDLLVILVGFAIAAIFGLPFSVASVILSINHLQSLTSKNTADDFIGPFLTVHEQRISSFVANVLLLMTPVMQPVLKFIPVPVLYGVFILALFRSFKEIQFAKRFLMLFMPKQKQPDLVYLRQVPLISANVFTVVQVFCTIILWAVRSTEAAIVFPIVMLLIHLVRYLLEYVLPMRDILVLDEPMRKASLCCQKHKEDQLLSDMESGKLMSDDAIHEDVVYDHNKVAERVNISEELSKTAAWKQLMKDELSQSAMSNSPSIERQSSRKRRKSRRKSAKDTSKDPTTFLLDQTDSQFKRKDSVKPVVSENISMVRNEPKDRKFSKDRQFSSRKRKKSREFSVKENRKQSPVESGNDEPLPPWEQPYHSPPRKDFGLLKIPEDDCSVDPACSRSESPPTDQKDSNPESRGDDTPPWADYKTYSGENTVDYYDTPPLTDYNRYNAENIIDYHDSPPLADYNKYNAENVIDYHEVNPDDSKSRDASSEEDT